MPPALKKAALSVHKMISEQKALESSVQNLEAVTSQFVHAHSKYQPVAAKAREMQLADVGALRQTRALAASQHSEGAGDMVQRLPRKLLEKTAAQMAVNQGDSAAQLALRVTDMGKTWNRILHPDPVLRAHPSWALPQLRARMPSAKATALCEPAW